MFKSDITVMINRYDFELELEKVAEKHYFNAATAQSAPRGGNSRGNEIYFGYLSPELRTNLNCQHILIKKGECPDSGILGDFNYRHEDEVDWEKIRNSQGIALEVFGPNREKRYLEFNVGGLGLPEKIEKDSHIEFKLNNLDEYGEFFGIEFKASKNSSQNAITVASFNSTCPSDTKTATLTIRMIHNLKTSQRKKFNGDPELKTTSIKLKIQFSMYYFIVNDEVNASRSKINHILVCRGKFFSLSTSESEATYLSKQKKPEDLNLRLKLYRVSLRYRPFFESKVIKANGYGLYTSWEPKIPKAIQEEKERQALLDEVEQIQQEIPEENECDYQPISDEDNVIYLTLREERIRRRSAA